MKIDGWNQIPNGYGLSWELSAAPLWLRVWFHLPLVDRFAYPQLIKRGFAWLSPHPDWPEDERDPVPSGWLVRERQPERPPSAWENYSPE
jgi:hypothetical protein